MNSPVLDAESSPQPWLGIRVRSNFERVAALHLGGRGFEAYCPTYTAEVQYSDRRKLVEKVLFPGYVFCRLDLSERLQVMTSPGFVSFLSFGHTIPPIPDVEIEQVRKLVESGQAVLPWPNLHEGQRVIIEAGPLEGVEGTLLHIKGKYRLVVSITLLQRSVSAEIDRRWVRPLAHRIDPHGEVIDPLRYRRLLAPKKSS